MSPVILHLSPSHVDARPGQGSHKDVAARRAHFQSLGCEYRYINLYGDDPAQLDSLLNDWRPTHVLIEYSYYPRIAKALRARLPGAYLAVRAHNIEPLQHLAVSTIDGPATLLRSVYVSARLLLADLQMARRADHIFAISPTEAQRYWAALGAGRKVSWLPYIPPPELGKVASPSRRVIACLPGARSNRTVDLVRRFSEFAQAARSAGWPERFVITGDVQDWPVDLGLAVEAVGFVGDLSAFYRDVLAVAILSPLGYGFKTTIGDAIWSGARVLAHPGIFAVVPDQLKPYCVSVESLRPGELERIRASLQTPAPQVDAETALARIFIHEMQRFLQRGHLVDN